MTLRAKDKDGNPIPFAVYATDTVTEEEDPMPTPFIRYGSSATASRMSHGGRSKFDYEALATVAFQTVEQMQARIAELEAKMHLFNKDADRQMNDLIRSSKTPPPYALMDNQELIEAAKDLPSGSLTRVLAERLEDEVGKDEMEEDDGQ